MVLLLLSLTSNLSSVTDRLGIECLSAGNEIVSEALALTTDDVVEDRGEF
jgi:hypothetical protein